MGFFRRLFGLEPAKAEGFYPPEPTPVPEPRKITGKTLQEVFGIGEPEKREADNADSLRHVFGASTKTTKEGLGRSGPSVRTFNIGDGDGFEMAIVGESYYGLELKRIAGDRLKRGLKVTFVAIVEREPQNPKDSNSVVVKGPNGKPVGHFSREYALEYQPVLKRIEAKRLVAVCNARMFGGSGRKKNIGVWLDMELPDALFERLSDEFETQAF